MCFWGLDDKVSGGLDGKLSVVAVVVGASEVVELGKGKRMCQESATERASQTETKVSG